MSSCSYLIPPLSLSLAHPHLLRQRIVIQNKPKNYTTRPYVLSRKAHLSSLLLNLMRKSAIPQQKQQSGSLIHKNGDKIAISTTDQEPDAQASVLCGVIVLTAVK